MISEKVIGTRLNMAVVERLEQLAVLKDKTVSQLIRMAVERLLEAEERTLHPLSLDAAVSLASSLKTETNILLDSATSLTNASYGNAGGVYLLVHPETRELYVGSSTELTARLTHHKFSIKTGTHKNTAINGWCLEEVVVVILESCEAKKDAATKRSLLEREQYYIDTLKLSKDWTLLNMVVASTSSDSSSGRRSQQVVASPPSKETPTVIAAVAAPTTPALTTSTNSVNVTAFEQFYSTVIEQSLIPVLDEKKSSLDVIRLYEGCRDEQEQRWFLEFLGSYNSQWLVSLGSSGKFPWISKLMDAAQQVT